ncbi:glycosyltransferase family 2 protein [Bosea caraganae]|nr:glycosyltransferase family 2 protein [Bosea caraganae]
MIFVNGPIDEASERLIATFENALIIRSAENQGLGFGLNRLVEAARDEGASQILLMDQDSTPQPGLAARLAGVLASRQAQGRRLAVVGPRLVPPHGENYRRLRYAWRDKAEGTVYFTPTSGSLVPIAAWNEIGPFRAEYFIDGIDVEWGLRAFGKGYDSLVASEITLDHRWGEPTAACEARTPQILRYPRLRCFFYIRNSAAMLRLPYVAPVWKLKVSGRLAMQIGLLLFSRRFGWETRQLVWRALRDGWHNRLGAAPAEIAASS